MTGAERPVDAAARTLAPRLGAIGADAGFVGVVASDGRTVEAARVTRDSDRPVPLEFPLDAPYPLAAAIRMQLALWIPDNETLQCEHPGIVRMIGHDHACATLPLSGEGGEALGAMNVTFEDPHEFTEEERAGVLQAAEACAAALQGAIR